MSLPLIIANAAGFWGDRRDAYESVMDYPGLQYLNFEYLAELTMAILSSQKQKNPAMGYVHDFPDVIKDLFTKDPHFRPKIITNAGGLNPLACAKKVKDTLISLGVNKKIAIVTEDSIDPNLYAKYLEPFDGSSLELPNHLLSLNAYFGAKGIVDALKQKADIVITGRVADASLTLGPCIYHFNWKWNDLDLLAQGTIAGHLLECGAQSTGGNCSGIPIMEDYELGFPIAIIKDDGSFDLTIDPHWQGIVSKETVSEQLIYEIGNLNKYQTPDVNVDISQVVIKKLDKNKVSITGCKGNEAPKKYKVTGTSFGLYKVNNGLLVYGEQALLKAQSIYSTIAKRLKKKELNINELAVEYIGAGGVINGKYNENATEIYLKITATSSDENDLKIFLREFAPMVTGGPPGVAGYAGGMPRPQKTVAFHSFLIDKNHLKPKVQVI